MSITYSDKLKDPRWQKKRLEILSRDDWACQSCFDTESTLVVHHRRYLLDRDPWDYPDSLLLTLCESCHEVEREECPNISDDLIAMVQEKFLSSDIYDLANGFHLLELQHLSGVVASAYSWALSSPEIQRELIERHQHYLLSQAGKDGKDAKSHT